MLDFIHQNKDLFLLVGFGFLVVVFADHFLTRGVEWLGDAANFNPKIKGKLLGFSTSLPELVATSSTAAHGLIGAGLWNVASSNIINCTLFVAAILVYRRGGSLVQVKFYDEIGFALSAFGLPLFLAASGGLERSPWTAVALFGVFLLYLYLDKLFNPEAATEYATEVGIPHEKQHSIASAVVLILIGIVGIMTVGYFLGRTAEGVVNRLGVPQYAVGWILGFITSLPEFATFFAVFRAAKRKGDQSDAAVQANLDNLAASNMSNLGIIFPIGIVVFLLSQYV